MPESKILMNEREAADYLGLSAKTLQSWRWRHEGPRWLKVGRLVKYKPADLEAYLEKRYAGAEG